METLALTVERAWSPEAERWLAAAQRHSTGSTAPVRRKVEEGSACLVIGRYEGEVVLVVALELERHAAGAQLVILAAGGRLPGVDLTGSVLPVLERFSPEAQSVRIQTCRPGLVRRLKAMGYRITHFVLQKRLALVAAMLGIGAAALGWLDVQAAPALLFVGDLFGGGGDSQSSSVTTTTQIDKRQVISDSAVGVTSDQSTVNVIATDLGANVGVNVSFLRGGVELTNAYMEDVLAGTYAIPRGGFDTIVVTSPVAQTVKVAIALGEGGSRRIAGDVNVVDNAKGRSVSGIAFWSFAATGAIAAQYAHAQLWNASANKRLIVPKIVLGCSSGNVGVHVRESVAALPALSMAARQKKLGGGDSVAAEARAANNAALQGAPIVQAFYVLANTPFLLPISEPIIIPPGKGIIINSAVVNSDIWANFDHWEELHT